MDWDFGRGYIRGCFWEASFFGHTVSLEISCVSQSLYFYIWLEDFSNVLQQCNNVMPDFQKKNIIQNHKICKMGLKGNSRSAYQYNQNTRLLAYQYNQNIRISECQNSEYWNSRVGLGGGLGILLECSLFYSILPVQFKKFHNFWVQCAYHSPGKTVICGEGGGKKSGPGTPHAPQNIMNFSVCVCVCVCEDWKWLTSLC